MRFAVLHHTGWPGRSDHYDLMLQFAAGDSDDSTVLKTFATVRDEFPSPPAELTPLADHRRAYLTFEGMLSENRGRVQRVDSGELRLLNAAGGAMDIEFELMGQKLRGAFRLHRLDAEKYIFERISQP